jgi:hypothetical protein
MVYKMQNGFPFHREPLSYLVAEKRKQEAEGDIETSWGVKIRNQTELDILERHSGRFKIIYTLEISFLFLSITLPQSKVNAHHCWD